MGRDNRQQPAAVQPGPKSSNSLGLKLSNRERAIRNKPNFLKTNHLPSKISLPAVAGNRE